MRTRQRISAIVSKGVLVAVLGLSLFHIARTYPANLRAAWDSTALDLYSYWYAGHFARLGIDPWQATSSDPIGVPSAVAYLDLPGNVAPPRPPEQDSVVLSLAPLAAPLYGLAWLSELAASRLWLVLNLIVTLVAPVLAVVTAARHAIRLSPLAALAAISLYVAAQPARTNLAIGQLGGLLLLVLVIACLLPRRWWLASGMLLAVDVAKLSLAAPGLAFFGVERRYRVLATAVAVHLAAVGAIWVAFGTPAPAQVLYYVHALNQSGDFFGVHLAYLLRVSRPLVWLAIGLCTALAAVQLALAFRATARAGQDAETRTAQASAAPFLALASTSLWALLAMYHGIYDACFAVFGAIVLLYLIDRSQPFGLGAGWRWALGGLGLAGLVLITFADYVDARVLRSAPQWAAAGLTPERYSTIASVGLVLVFAAVSAVALRVLAPGRGALTEAPGAASPADPPPPR